MGQSIGLPDFECADLDSFDPLSLVSTPPSSLDKLMLALALAFNDLKGILLFSEWMKGHEPDDPNTPSPYLGQYAGMKVQLKRLAAALAHEAILLLRSHIEVVDGPEMADLVSRLPHNEERAMDPRRRWEHLLGLVRNEKEGVAVALQRTRNTVAYHYYQPEKLMQCYLSRYRGTEGEPPIKSRAFVSLGASMERTRFYYADAAAESVLEWAREQGEIEDFGAELNEVVGSINLALKPLLRAHLERKLGLELQRKGE